MLLCWPECRIDLVSYWGDVLASDHDVDRAVQFAIDPVVYVYVDLEKFSFLPAFVDPYWWEDVGHQPGWGGGGHGWGGGGGAEGSIHLSP